SVAHTSPLSLHDALPISSPLGSARREEGEGSGSAGDGFSVLGRSSLEERWTMAQRPRIGPMDHAEAHRPLLRRREALLALGGGIDRKSTRLNSSHQIISY